MMLAVTPALAALMASRMPASVLLLLSMLRVTGVLAGSATKPADAYWPFTGVPLVVPSVIVMLVALPSPTVLLVSASPGAGDTSFCTWASLLTCSA